MSTKLLLFGVLLAISVIPIFADETWVVVVTDKAQYFPGETMEISGYILERKMPVIAMSIYDPDGTILSANNIELQEDDSFAKVVSLDSPFYDKAGVYLIELDYRKNTVHLTFEMIGTLQPEPQPIPQITPEVIFLDTDKNAYSDSELITVSGIVSAVGDPTILIGIYDQNAMPTGFYTPQISSELEFSVSFLAKSGVNFKTPGKYYAKAHYGESKQTTSFDFVDTVRVPQNQKPTNPVVSPPTQIIQPSVSKQENRQPTQIVDDKKPQKTSPKPISVKEDKPKEQDNLSVEDQELGKMLNEITLNCDYSEYSDTIVYYDGMGPALMRLCNYEPAISYFDKSLIEDPNNVDILTNKATAYSKLGKLDVAIEYYDTALAIKPKFFPAMNNKANALAQLGKFEEAISTYESILKEDPTNAKVQSNLQKAKENLNQYTKTLQKTQEITPLPIPMDEPNVTETPKINYELPQEKPKNIIEQIGSAFASLFGFLS